MPENDDAHEVTAGTATMIAGKRVSASTEDGALQVKVFRLAEIRSSEGTGTLQEHGVEVRSGGTTL
jgi:hypothetical protein